MNYRQRYLAQGYLSPLDIIDAETAARHRKSLARRESMVAIHPSITCAG